MKEHRLRILLLILSLQIFLNVSAFSQNLKIYKEEFDDIKELAEKIKSACPPEECLVVGIGRSPTPVTTLLKMERDHYAWTVPLSSFRYGIGPFKPALQDDQKMVLFEHFDKYFPKPEERRGRRILLVDLITSGDSLAAARNYAQEYLNLGQGKVTLKTGAISLMKASGESFNFDHYWILPLGPLYSHLSVQYFDDWAEFKNYSLEANPAGFDLRNEKKYEEFVAAMKKAKLKNDVLALSVTSNSLPPSEKCQISEDK